MLIRLNRFNKGMVKYDPPFEVKWHPTDSRGDNYRPIDRTAPPNEQVEELLWLAVVLVSRYVYQFPFLENEKDELFSIVTEVIVDKVHNSDVSGEDIGSHVFVKGCSMIEDYVNCLDEIVRSSTRTKYTKFNRGLQMPKSVKLMPGHAAFDDNTETLVRDAAESLGYEPDNMTLNQRRQVAQTLGFKREQYIRGRKKR